MTPARDAHLVDLIVGLRTPLLRVELAATQLARGATTPVSSDLAAGISEAVSRLDARIDEALRVLAEPPRPTAEDVDCRRVVDALRARMQPVLRARSVEWSSEPTSDEPPVLGDGEECGSGALTLLVAGLELAGPGGRLSLGVVGDDDARCGVRLLANRTGDDAQLEPREWNRILAPVWGFAQSRGGDLEVHDTSRDAHMTLWMRRGAQAACDA